MKGHTFQNSRTAWEIISMLFFFLLSYLFLSFFKLKGQGLNVDDPTRKYLVDEVPNTNAWTIIFS